MNNKNLNKNLSKCVYCCCEATTCDHVPPKQLFPKPRPNDLEEVPACFQCNNQAGKDEEYFLATFMFSEAGVSDAGKQLWKEKLHRMYEKNLGLRGIIACNLKPKDIYTPHGIFVGKRMTIELDENRITEVARKIVRGLYYIEYQEIMPSSQDLDCLFLKTQANFDAVKEHVNQLKNGSKSWEGIFQYRYNRTEEGRHGSMWLLNFYGFATFWLIGYDKQFIA